MPAGADTAEAPEGTSTDEPDNEADSDPDVDDADASESFHASPL